MCDSSLQKVTASAGRKGQHCNENPSYVFLDKELRGLSRKIRIHVSVSDLYTVFPGSVHIFSCRRIGRRIVGIYKSLTDT
jgi:hypothetical protein